jgi:hypothetical protein
VKPVLVVVPDRPGACAPARPRVEICSVLPPSLEPFSSVVVVEGRAAGTARRLVEVLRRSGPAGGPRIGVLSFVDGLGPRPGAATPGSAALRLGRYAEVPSIEYQFL